MIKIFSLFKAIKMNLFGIKFMFSCNRKTYEDLKSLQKDLRCKSQSELMQRSLSLLDFAVQERDENHIVSINGNQIIIE